MTTPRFPPHLMVVALLVAPGWAVAEVSVRLAETTLSQDKPLQVTFEASGASVASPDLTPLQADFEILNRSVQQRSSTINGRRTQWTSLSLLLRAKRAGKLEIPALRFGSETSRPQAITILAGADVPTSGIPQGPGASGRDISPPWDPFGMQSPQLGAPMGPGMSSPFAPIGGIPTTPFPQLPGASATGSPAPGMPAPGTPPLMEPVTAPTSDADRTWSWIAGFAAAGWLGTLFLCSLRHRRRYFAAAVVPPKPTSAVLQTPQPEEELPEARAVRQVANAYQRSDAAAAREALLAWGRLTWVVNPPGNLSRLAERLSEPLRGYVLELDEALYSPTPVAWEQRPLPDLLPNPVRR